MVLAAPTQLKPAALRLLIMTEAGFLTYVAIYDMFTYARDFSQWLTLMIWLTTAVLNFVALYGIIRKRAWGAALLLAAQAAVAAFLVYVLAVETRSPTVDLISLVLTAGLLCLTGVVGWHAYKASGETKVPKKLWIGIAALLPLAGLFQFWMQNFYVPQHDRPQVDLVTELEEIGRTDNIAHMRGTITLHNRGKVDVNAVGSLYQIRAFSYANTSDDVPIEAAVTGLDWRYADTGRARGLVQPGALVQVDEMMTLDEFLTPDETWTKSVAFAVNMTGKDVVRLAAEAAFVTNRTAASHKVCDHSQEVVFGGPERYLVQTGADQSRYICVETRFPPRNTVRSLFDDDPVIKTYVVLSSPGLPDLPVPDLQVSLEAGALVTPALSQSQLERVSAIIDRGLPWCMLSSHTEYPLHATPK
ncbi:MAG: hypothetical protein QOF58_3188 [Pseudonocardiales bacterium]|jgi:hypothetical protein|nr:hypothetical protein [Pseudonocardiales bacterium]